MTEKLYDADSHLKEFEARVLSCTPCEGGFAAVLDRTAFFPEGGGQPCDLGTLAGAQVLDVQLCGEEIVHTAASPLAVGETVRGELDWARRFDFMQQHSAEHIVSGLVHRLFGYDNVGFHLSRESVTLDFNGLLTPEQLQQIEQLANERIWQNVRFDTFYPDAAALAGLDYRSKKEIIGAVRLVEIEDTDLCACCAPHVSHAAEIGAIHLEDGGRMRGGSRLWLLAGGRAVEDYRAKSMQLHAAGARLSVKPEEVPDTAERLCAALEEQKLYAAGLKKRLIAALADSSGEPVLFIPGLDGGELQQLADRLHRQYGGLRAVFSPGAGGCNFVLCDEETALAPVFDQFCRSFAVRGGGRGGMRRGFVQASAEALKTYFQF